MSPSSRFLTTAAGVACAAGLAFAAEQTILGKSLTVKDGNPGVDPTRRKASASAREKNSANALVGDPTQMGSAGGAILELFANGANSSRQVFELAQGTSSTGKPFWSGDATTGFKYKDAKGNHGAVKSIRIKRSGSGSFSVKISVSGKGGPLTVMPPNPGTDGCAALKLGLAASAGDRYSLQFGPESKIKNSGDKLFSANTPMAEGVCPAIIPPVIIPCGATPYPTCGEACPDAGICGAIQGPGVNSECACFAQDDPCGGFCGFQCGSQQDCEAELPGCTSSVGGWCPPGLICTAAIAEIFPCPPEGTCIVVTAMCTQ